MVAGIVRTLVGRFPRRKRAQLVTKARLRAWATLPADVRRETKRVQCGRRERHRGGPRCQKCFTERRGLKDAC